MAPARAVMPGYGLIRKLYSWASAVPALRRPLDAIRSQSRVRAFARRRVGVLLAQGTTWANVDGALRLLAEDPHRRIVFGPWQGDAALELLYWAPFVRWAQDHFALDPARLVVVSRGEVRHWYSDACRSYADVAELETVAEDAAVFRPEPILALVEEYRQGSAPLRPLLKRSKHVLLQAPDGHRSRPAGACVVVDLGPSPAFPPSDSNRAAAERLLGSLAASSEVVVLDRTLSLNEQHALIAGATGLVAAYSGLALVGAFSGIPVVALRSSAGDVSEPDLDLALRITGSLGGSLTLLDTADLGSLADAIGRR